MSTDVYSFIDTTNNLSFQDIISGKYDSAFKKTAKDAFYTSKLNVNYWLMFRLKNVNATKNWLVEFPDPHISKIIFYRKLPDGSFEKTLASGFDYPFSNKEFNHKNFVFNVRTPKDSIETFYAVINSNNTSSLSVFVRETTFFSGYALREYVLLGFFYGVLLIMAIYNLFLYFNTKDLVYLFYVFYTLCCALNSFSEDGLGFQYIWPNLPVINSWVMLGTPPLLVTAFMIYSYSFLKITQFSSKFSYLIIIFYFLYIIFYVVEKFVSGTRVFYPFVYLIPFILIYLVSFQIYLKGEKYARFFILAYTMIIISFVIFVLRMFDLVPVTLFTVYSFNFGFLIEVVILSIALGDRIRIERHHRELLQYQAINQLKENESLKNTLISELKEKEVILDRVNKELETKVAIRTQDLQKKTDELSIFNSNLSKLVEDLNQMNIKLDVDNWQLKQKVQEEVKARLSDEELSTDKFKELFPDEAACLRYLENIKWENGFVCKRCGHDRYISHTSPFTRKCTSCKHVESVTADTLFHGIRIPMDKAFYIVYDTIRSGKSKTLEELSDLLGLNKNTIWAFRKKIQAAYDYLKTKSKGGVVKWDELLSN
ncbi:7TM diverse intracellular signaling domain-containing protein [Cytophaga hutchinsonii]|uniref:Chromosome segregation ATPase intracellular signaling protein n=1 Tax=Cytophaga hutchinsonii (strain ATCC 33406 / DSM 1761 / CIP 103989 / NBRC 15051 / NCIMB 9469 / D465) TaxID=269798 RepID=A0A6N4SRA6_CYTH3|nr:7TM diverse intracellular signaling domain-containing protein [Cytophaga hutchinsonii]ABG58922.1 chromosome segregation ATPase; intracellular signaling protein [Cytophaga hutchinsonii ATCC 33406]